MARSPSVLVVDDEPNMRKALQAILTMGGFKARTAPDGGTALRRVVSERPDVVLLDLAMPGMDGENVRDRIRELSPATSVVYFTAKVDPFDRTELRRLRREGDGILTKPATRRQILSAIRRVLEVDPRNDRLDTGNRTASSR